MEPRKPGPGAGRELGEAWRYDSLGYTFALSVLLFAGLGWLLDRFLGTRPFLTIAGTLVGAGLAMAWVIAKVRADQDRYQARHHRAEPPPEDRPE